MGIFDWLFSASSDHDSASGSGRYLVGVVAGIEAVEIDGELHYYAYSHSDDLVVSPLFANAQSMAEYAEKNLAQRDGRHDQSYWLEVARYAESESGLFEQIPSVTLKGLQRLLLALRAAEETGQVQPDIPRIKFIEYIVLDLDRESGPHPKLLNHADLVRALGLDSNELHEADVSTLIAHVSGEGTYMEDKPVSESARFVRLYLSEKLALTEESWRTAFAELTVGDFE